MLSKTESIGITVGVALLASVAVMMSSMKKKKLTAGVLFLVVLAVGITITLLMKHHGKETFTSSSTSSDGCVQNIHITQNCDKPSGGGGHVTPSHLAPLNVGAMKKWIKSINPDLTSGCVQCVVDSAMKMWNMGTLGLVKGMSMEKQKGILDGLLAFDCSKQCVITPATLHPPVAQVQQWLSLIMPGMEQSCFKCVTNTVVKMWTLGEFNEVKSKPLPEQAKVVRGLLAFNCEDCAVEKLSRKQVQDWLSTQLTGAKPSCYGCLVDNIVRMWDFEQFNKVKNMDSKSRRQVIQALIALNCMKECVYVPSGLTKQQVQQWVDSVLTGANKACVDCLVNFVYMKWSVADFRKITAMKKEEQHRVIMALMIFDCDGPCGHQPNEGPDHPDIKMVQKWVENILQKDNKLDHTCVSCIVNYIHNNNTKKSFAELAHTPTADHAKYIYSVAHHQCVGKCNLHPMKSCSVLPY